MLTAIDPATGEQVLCEHSGQVGTCPVCGEEVHGRKGEVVAAYYAHKPDPASTCPARTGETPWHRMWKATALRMGARVEVPIGDHRADIEWNGLIIEAQSRSLGAEDREGRRAEYGPRLMWLIRADYQRVHDEVHASTTEGARWVTSRRFLWLHGQDVPVIVDLGSHVEVWVRPENHRRALRALCVFSMQVGAAGSSSTYGALFEWLADRAARGAEHGFDAVIAAELEEARAYFREEAQPVTPSPRFPIRPERHRDEDDDDDEAPEDSERDYIERAYGSRARFTYRGSRRWHPDEPDVEDDATRRALRTVPKWIPDESPRTWCACGHTEQLHTESRHGPGCAGRSIHGSDGYRGPCGCTGFEPLITGPDPGWSPEMQEHMEGLILRRSR